MKLSSKWLLLALALTLPLAAQAHRFWLLPSQTVLSGGHDNWITVDGAVSNDLFYFNHHALGLDNLVITAPDGSTLQPQNAHMLKWRSVFDVKLPQEGTYKLAIASHGLQATYKVDGERKRWFGTAAELGKIPATATDRAVYQRDSRVEAFVTVGAPTDTVLKPTGQGLELLPVTHPNDLYAGEKADFKMLIDGKPAAGVKVSVIRGATRYRDGENAIEATTAADGRFSIIWPQAGMYWLNAEIDDAPSAVKAAKSRRLAYVATLEVLPL